MTPGIPTGYDIIGDVHGQADKLVALLDRMGHAERAGAWQHPKRQAIFVGDLIDRGPQQPRTVELARAMVERGHAQAIMGNHEFNAIAWSLPDPVRPGQFMREHSEKNRQQHRAFLAEVEGDPCAACTLHRLVSDAAAVAGARRVSRGACLLASGPHGWARRKARCGPQADPGPHAGGQPQG